jgi:hypothetical protein
MISSSRIYSILSVILFALIIFLGNNNSAFSQSPSDFFVGGANLYINGDSEKAKNLIDTGLSKYPDDKKLQALKKAIEEEKKDKNQDQDKDKKQDQNKDQQNNNKDQQDQQQQDKNQDQQKQQKDGYISKEDAQRLLDALANDEKNVQEKVKEAKAAKARVRTVINW